MGYTSPAKETLATEENVRILEGLPMLAPEATMPMATALRLMNHVDATAETVLGKGFQWREE